MSDWRRVLRDDPLPWLLEEKTPAVRHLALRRLLNLSEDTPEVRQAREAAMHVDPIATILDAQAPEGYWGKPGPGYTPKYRGTVWQVSFLDQMGADGSDPRVRAACEYVLGHTQAKSGGFAYWGGGSRPDAPPPPSLALHCLNGNLLCALIGFGYLDDERVQRSIEWQARAITGENFDSYYLSGTTGPGFRCGSNNSLPCAWGAIKGLAALARIPADKRALHIQRAIQQGVEFLLSCDPATAEYPAGYGDGAPSPAWFALGFPLAYPADLLQNLSVLGELGFAKDPRVQHAVTWLLAQQDEHGRWSNRAPLKGKMWGDIDMAGAPSKWVTLHACAVLKAVYG